MDNRQDRQVFLRQVFPLLYEAHHANYLEDLPFWLDLADRSGGPILELGCGTGRVTLPLAQHNQAVFALDNDPFMLRFLQEKQSRQSSLRIYPFLADMTAFHLDQTFDSIVLPCNTISTLTPIQRRHLFNQVSRHLTDSGVFTASLPNPELLSTLPVYSASELDEIIEHPIDHEPVQISSEWRRSKGIFSLTWHYDHLSADGRVERMNIQVQHSLDRLASYRDDLDSQGLKILEVYGNFDCSPYSPDSPNLILAAGLG